MNEEHIVGLKGFKRKSWGSKSGAKGQIKEDIPA